jgi:hypothetical protein
VHVRFGVSVFVEGFPCLGFRHVWVLMLLLWVCWNAFIGMDCTGMGHLDWYSIPPLYAGTIPESTYLLFNMHMSTPSSIHVINTPS